MNQQSVKEKQQFEDMQVFRVDGKNVFVEVMRWAFDIDKVVLNFMEYDPNAGQGQRKKTEITVYLDIPEFLQLAQDMKSGRLAALAKNAKADAEKGGYKFCKHIYQHMGGTAKEKLAQRGQSRADGKDLSRIFKITPGSKSPWMLSAETGPGEATDKGLIAPKYSRPEEIVRVPMSDDHFKQLFLVAEKYIEGYITAKMMQSLANRPTGRN